MPLLSQSEKEMRRMRQSLGVGVADDQPGKNDLNDGQQQLAVIDGIVNDVKKINGDLYHNRIFKTFEEQTEAMLNEESLIKVQHKFTGNPVFDPGFQSDTFSSGFAGSGYRINKETASDFSSPNTAYNIEIDNMIVRGTLSVYELLIQQIRATNGSIFVTSAAKVESASGLSATDDVGTITFDDPSGKGLCPFADGDIIMMQRVDPGSTVSQGAAADAGGVVKKLVYKVNGSPNGATITVENASFNNLSYPVEGDEFVRIGNDGTTSNRDGVIYLTSDDSNAPFIDIKSDIDSYADWYGNEPKVRLGNLAGITNANVNSGNALSGYGLFTNNVYLIGEIVATSGKIGGVNIAASKVYVGTGTVNNSNTGFYLDSSGNFSLKDKLYWNGTSLVINGAGTFTGDVSIGSGDSIFKADSNGIYLGDATFADAEFSVTPAGLLKSTSGTIAGWNINPATFNTGSGSSYMEISQTDQKIRIGAKTSRTNANTGVHIGTDGIGLGSGSVFQVTEAGVITATSGTIGGWVLSNNALTSATTNVQLDQNEQRITLGAKRAIDDSNDGLWLHTTGMAIGANEVFKVTSAGALTATSATITGAITATSGTFTGSINASGGTFTGHVTAGNMKFGLNVNSTLDGIYIDANDYWYDTGNFSMGNGGVTWNGSTLAVNGQITCASGSSFTTGDHVNIESGGDAYFSSNRVKFKSNGSISLVGGTSGTTGLIFYPPDDSPATGDHTGDYWSVFQGSTANDLGHMYNGSVKMYWRTDGDVEMNTGQYLHLGMGSDADTGIRRNSGHLEVLINDGGTSHDFRPTTNGTQNCGGSSNRWENVYASNGTIETSDATEKESIEDSNLGLNFINKLRPISYKWIGKTRTHYGLTSQQVKEVMDDLGISTTDFAGYIAPEGASQGLRYRQFIAPMIKAIQELKAEVEELKNSS